MDPLGTTLASKISNDCTTQGHLRFIVYPCLSRDYSTVFFSTIQKTNRVEFPEIPAQLRLSILKVLVQIPPGRCLVPFQLLELVYLNHPEPVFFNTWTSQSTNVSW